MDDGTEIVKRFFEGQAATNFYQIDRGFEVIYRKVQIPNGQERIDGFVWIHSGEDAKVAKMTTHPTLARGGYLQYSPSRGRLLGINELQLPAAFLRDTDLRIDSTS